MMNVFSQPPSGLQLAPHEPRLRAAGYQIAVREIDFSHVRDKEALMLAFLRGLALTESFGRNWDALYDVLTDRTANANPRRALLLTDYLHFRKTRPQLAQQLEEVLLDAQRFVTEQGGALWLLTEEDEVTPPHR